MFEKFTTLALTSFLFISTSIANSKIEELDFVGIIRTVDSLQMSYRLQLTINDGSVSGYSITDYLGALETKTKIIGKYDYKSHQLFFTETDLIHTKASIQSDLCYIEATTILSSNKGQARLTGNFIGKYSDSVACAEGTLELLNTKYLVKFSKKLDKILSKRTSKDSVDSNFTDDIVEIVRSRSSTLNANETIEFKWNSDILKLELWDQGFEDDDRVTIMLDGKKIIDNHKLTKEKKGLLIKVTHGMHKLELIALNNGTDFPNTCTMSLHDGKNVFRIISTLNSGDRTYIVINK